MNYNFNKIEEEQIGVLMKKKVIVGKTMNDKKKYIKELINALYIRYD
jgi:hypothetical protein